VSDDYLTRLLTVDGRFALVIGGNSRIERAIPIAAAAQSHLGSYTPYDQGRLRRPGPRRHAERRTMLGC
jgi:hypothetical protein